MVQGLESALDTWFRVADKAQWRSLDDIRQTYQCADGVEVEDRIYMVWNVGGNKVSADHSD